MRERYKTGRLYRLILISAILASVVFPSGAQDTVLVKGVVYSNTNIPVAGVSISIEGSDQRPVLSSESGEFTLRSASGKDWIIVSPASGYKVKTSLSE